ncbi:hypothetical protein FQA39_LY12918 [Lamprigera yunnana]|nr:hypothetical protein FQA39_LY12918 [Lamprigera yunnana]
MSNGVFVERTFPLHSPIIDKVTLIKRGRVRSLAAVTATAGTAMTVVSCDTNNTKSVSKTQADKEIHAGLKKTYETEDLAKKAIEALKEAKFTIEKVEVKEHTDKSVTFNLLLKAKKGYKLSFDGKYQSLLILEKHF